ncbi:MAG: tRNA glutamyl-Q(34) synthetase GluQRS [Steroidobacteraceae bacterium]|nr:tRNA glutamyl-Q(34) synthetase GluQRS [Steroidobacteraceae bacterium]
MNRTPGTYVGRFAPSPTGSLHLGSLVAAVGSFLDARHHNGRWLVRMEDLDRPRVVPGRDAEILRTLESFGLTWDGEVLYQSGNTERYADALETLRRAGHTYECSCSRRARAGSEDGGYRGTCRYRSSHETSTATRFRVDDRRTVTIMDRFQGECRFDMRRLGDVIVRRRDGMFAYQLAVVVDDADQGVTHVVRGADLLASTAWQVCLQGALNLNQPEYGHLPLIVEPDGTKLAKSRRSVPLDPTRAGPLLLLALRLLRQPSPPAGIEFESPASILYWALGHWQPLAFRGIRELPAPVSLHTATCI